MFCNFVKEKKISESNSEKKNKSQHYPGNSSLKIWLAEKKVKKWQMSSHKFYLLKDFWRKLDETSKSFGYHDRFYFLGNKKI